MPPSINLHSVKPRTRQCPGSKRHNKTQRQCYARWRHQLMHAGSGLRLCGPLRDHVVITLRSCPLNRIPMRAYKSRYNFSRITRSVSLSQLNYNNTTLYKSCVIVISIFLNWVKSFPLIVLFILLLSSIFVQNFVSLPLRFGLVPYIDIWFACVLIEGCLISPVLLTDDSL